MIKELMPNILKLVHIFTTIVSEISATHKDDDGIRKYYYLKVDKTVKSNHQLISLDKIIEIYTGGRGSTKYMKRYKNFFVYHNLYTLGNLKRRIHRYSKLTRFYQINFFY